MIFIYLKVCNVLFLAADVGSACLRTLDWAVVMQERDIANLLWGQLLNQSRCFKGTSQRRECHELFDKYVKKPSICENDTDLEVIGGVFVFK